jgi:WD40 repeat protein
MRVSADGQLLAAGDTAGNVHVYDVATLQLLVVQEAHDSDVLCLDFSPPPQQQQGPGPAAAAAANHSSKRLGFNGRDGRGLAVSGSHDTLVHVYDAYNGFRLLETLDDHEAEVTAVRFTAGGRGLVSCGADHSIIFRCGNSAGHSSPHLVQAQLAVQCGACHVC